MVDQPALFDAPTDEIRPIVLYGWQGEAVERLRDNIRKGIRRQILSAPTGSGKTEIAGHMIDKARGKGTKCLFVVDRESLIEQTSRRFTAHGIPHGIIQATHWRHRPHEYVQICSVQTLMRRGWPEGYSLIFIDEAHSQYASTVERMKEGDCYVVGLTATPFTKGLGLHYEDVVTVRTTNQLIAEGKLCDFRIFAPSQPDMSGAKKDRFGEWTRGEAEKRSLPIVGDIVQQYLRHADGRKFIAFGATIKHCEEIHKQLAAAGIEVRLYTANTPDEERKEILRDFRGSKSPIRGLVSVAALAKGFDEASVDVIIIARPLRKSLAEHIQILGRGLRRDPENPAKQCLILDHAGNCLRFWDRMHDFFENGAPPLDMGEKPEKSEKKEEKEEVSAKQCPECKALHKPMPKCPECGHEYPRRSGITHVEGELVELGVTRNAPLVDKQAVYSQLIQIAADRKYNQGWAKWMYREKFGVWPRGVDAVPAPVTQEVRNWVMFRQIAKAKAKEKAAKEFTL